MGRVGGGIGALADEVLFDVEFGLEVGHRGWVGVGVCGPAAVAGRLDEVGDAVGDGGVD